MEIPASFPIPYGNSAMFSITPMEFHVLMCQPYGISTLLSLNLRPPGIFEFWDLMPPYSPPWKFHYPQRIQFFFWKSPISKMKILKTMTMILMEFINFNRNKKLDAWMKSIFRYITKTTLVCKIHKINIITHLAGVLWRLNRRLRAFILFIFYWKSFIIARWHCNDINYILKQRALCIFSALL